MRQEWLPEDLIESWTLLEADWELVAGKRAATRLGFSLVLKFYEIEGRFPAFPEEVPAAAVVYMAGLVKVDAALFGKYSWQGSTIEYHRAQIRGAFGTRPPTELDEEMWARWLAGEVCPVETSRDRLAEALLRRCRSGKVEPPAAGQVERIVASAGRRHEEVFAAATVTKLGPGVCVRILGVLDEEGLLAELKADPGPLGLDTLFAEIAKLRAVKALGLPDGLFAETSDRLVAAWRARAARMFPSDFIACAGSVRVTLLAALCWTRQGEITDALVELLIGLIYRVNARAERRVEKELIGELAEVSGKKGIFLEMVSAALDKPDETVRQAVWPVVPGGELTLRKLARELMATEKAWRERVRVQLRGSYTHYYRRMLARCWARCGFRATTSPTGQ